MKINKQCGSQILLRKGGHGHPTWLMLTDEPTDQWTDKVSCKVACLRLLKNVHVKTCQSLIFVWMCTHEKVNISVSSLNRLEVDRFFALLYFLSLLYDLCYWCYKTEENPISCSYTDLLWYGILNTMVKRMIYTFEWNKANSYKSRAGHK